MKNQNVYKILSIEEWNKAQKLGYINTDLDKKDGFIHFSSANQLAATLELYFSDHEEVMLLMPNMKKIETDLKYELPDTGSMRKGFFAHLYGDLMIEDIQKSWQIKRGAFQLPQFILLEAEHD
tara:strand:+ start:27 stop:395 length:369 start_codon:yes stop_codon:yes gene_type:complete